MPGEAQAKEVKVAFSVDTASADKLRRVLSSITDDVNKLVEATSKLNFGTKVGNFSSGKGLSSGKNQLNAKVGQGNSGFSSIVGDLTKAASNSAGLFKTASTESIKSFNMMGSALRDMVNKSDSEMKRLERTLSKVGDKYHDFLKMGKAGVRIEANDEFQSTRREYFKTAGEYAEVKEARKKFKDQLDEVEPPSLWERIKSKKPFKEKFPNMFAAYEGVGAGAAVGAAALMAITGGSGQFRRSNVDYFLEKPLFTSQKEASYGQVFGGYALAGRNGDAATAHAISLAAKDADFKNILGAHYTEALVKKAKLNAPTGIGEALGHGPGAILSNVAQRFGRVSEHAITGISGITPDNFGNLTGQEIDREKAMALVAKYQPETYAQLVANKLQSDPLFAQTANSMYQGVFSNIGGINASRTGGTTIKDKFGNIKGNSYTQLQRRIMENYFDPNEVFGMMGQLSPTLGRHLSGPGIAEKMLSLNSGGFNTGANVFSAGSQFGHGLKGGNALINTFQHLIGGRGVDIGAGSSIGSLVSNSMLGGNFMGNQGTGLAQVLLNATYTGNPGSEMRNARAMGSGLNAMDSFASGSLDPLQGAINMSSALSAAGNMPYQLKRL